MDKEQLDRELHEYDNYNSLERMFKDNILWKKTHDQVEDELREYYIEKDRKQELNNISFIRDMVTSRILELLKEDDFELKLDYLKYINKFLFQDVYEIAGEFRTVNFSKCEKILSNYSVIYGDYCTLKESLEHYFFLENNKDYNKMDIIEVIYSIANFSSCIWQIHPFRDGNTRTIALFTQKYLISLGYNVDNTLFKEKSVYFRNALVRSNYFNNSINVKENSTFLIKFYENLLLGKNNNLHSNNLIVEELCDKKMLKRK